MPITQEDVDGIYNKVRGFYANKKIRENPDDPSSPVVGREYKLKSSNVQYGNPTLKKHTMRNSNAERVAYKIDDLRDSFRERADEMLEQEVREVDSASKRFSRIGGAGAPEKMAAETELQDAEGKQFEGYEKLHAEYGALLVHHEIDYGNCQEQSAVTLFECLSDPQFASKVHNAYLLHTAGWEPGDHMLPAFSDGPDKPATGLKLRDLNASNSRGLWFIDTVMKFKGPALDYVEDVAPQLAVWADEAHGAKGFVPVDENGEDLPMSQYNHQQYAKDLFDSSYVVTEIPKLLRQRFVQTQRTRSGRPGDGESVALRAQERQRPGSSADPRGRRQPDIDNTRGTPQQERRTSPRRRAGVEDRPSQNSRIETQREPGRSRSPAR